MVDLPHILLPAGQYLDLLDWESDNSGELSDEKLFFTNSNLLSFI